MKGHDIIVGKQYAVREVMSGVRGGGFPRCAPIRHVTVIEKQSNGRVLCEYGCLVPDPVQRAETNKKEAWMMRSDRRYVEGKRLLTVLATDVVCLSEDFENPQQPDGRIDAPRVTRAEGKRFDEFRMAFNA